MRLQGKVAVITGGTSGIGRATARLFCKEGAKVVIAGRTVKTGEETVEMIKKEGGEVTYVCTDVSKASDVENLVNETIKKYGRIDILFADAGVHIAKHTNLEDIDEKDWDQVIDINLKGVFLVTKYSVPIMKKQGGGSIICTSSTFAFVGSGDIAYSASKGGVKQFAQAAALELGPYNIRVNSIHPGSTGGITPEGFISYGRLIKYGTPEAERRKERAKDFPIGRLGTYEEIAYAVLFLASDESSFVTGAPLIVDGGYLAK